MRYGQGTEVAKFPFGSELALCVTWKDVANQAMRHESISSNQP